MSVIRITIGVILMSVAGDLEKYVGVIACIVCVFCIVPCLFVRTCLFCLHLGAKSCVFSAAAWLLVGSIRLSSVVGSSVCYR